MRSYRRLGWSNPRVIALLMTLGLTLLAGATVQAAPQYQLACDDCHTMPPLDSVSGQRLPATGAFKGNHQSHADDSAGSCVKCHGPGALLYDAGHRTRSIELQGNINNSPAGSYSRVFVNQSSVPPSPLGSCSSVNCHFERLTPAWGSASFSTPSDCDKCHGAAPSAGHPVQGSKHGAYYGTGTGSCLKCHPDHTAEAKPFAHATSVTGRGVSVLFAAAPNYGGSYSGPTDDFLPSQSKVFGTCSGLYCHSDGTSLSGPYSATSPPPAWGGSATLGCNGCHGGPAAVGSSILATGKHQAHIANAAALGSNYGCVECHAKTVASDSLISATAKHANAFVDYSGAKAGNASSYSAGSCSASYCHSSGKKGKAGMASTVEPATPSWSGAALSCNGCHGARLTPTAGVAFNSVAGEPNYQSGAAGSPSANSHQKHVGAAGAGSCANCHSKTTSTGSSISAGSQHTDGFINFTSGNGKSFGKVAGKSCSNISCHGGNGVVAATANAQWGATLGCNGCHGGPAALGSNIIVTGKHAQHSNQAAVIGDNLGCSECHAKTVASNTAISDPVQHLNNFLDYSGARAGKSSTLSAGSCSATYCHSSGKKGEAGMAATVEPAVPSWSGAAMGCKGCHGAQSMPTAGIDFNSVAGEPNYLNGGSGAPSANSHKQHVGSAGAASCANCHSKSTLNGSSLIAGSQHLNAYNNYTSGNGKSFGRQPDKSCSNVSCHSGNGIVAGVPSAQWGDTLGCNGCHGGPAALLTNVLASGKHSAHLNNPGTNYGCVECHAKTVSSDTAILDTGKHGNAFVDYSGVRAGKSSSYSGGTCSASYCHSSGKKGQTGMVATVEPASPSWSGAALTCKGCHGARVTPTAGVAFNSVAGEPNYTGGAAGSASANSHQKHVKADGAATCVYCHNATVDASGSAIIGNHANKSVEVASGGGRSFGYPGGKSCSNISCHSGSAFTSANAIWGSNLDCKGCHATLSSGHTRHVGTGWNTLPFYNYTANLSSGSDTDGVTRKSYSFGCANCHPVTPASHLNGSVEVENGPVAGGSVLRNKNSASALIGSVGSGTLRCSNVYCHANVTTPQWNQSFSAATRCGGCHGNAPANDSHLAHKVGIHYDTIFSGTSGLLPASGAVGVNAGHGDPAQSSTIGCNICHYSTVTTARNKYNSSCSSVACHGNATGSNADATGAARIANLAFHVNGANNVAFAPSTLIRSKAQVASAAFASYTAGVAGWNATGRVYKNGTATAYDRSKNNLTVGSYVGGNCSNISCHNGETANWVDDFGSGQDCVMCHRN